MARKKGHRLVDVAMGDRNAGIGKPADACRNAGNDAYVDSGLNKCLGFLAPTAENERVAALQPQHTLVLAGKLDQPKRDVALAW